MPTVAWSKCMADKSQYPTAGCLLSGLAAILHATRAGPLIVASIAEKTNDVTDLALGSYNSAARVPKSPFPTPSNTCFPLPQSLHWKLLHLTPEMTLLVISMLAGKGLQLQQWMTKYEPKIGTAGWNSAQMHTVTHASLNWTNPSNSNSCLLVVQGFGEVTTVKGIQSKLKHPKPPSVTWHKPSSWLAFQTLYNPTVHTS
jgi:hypothetical protein